MGWAFSVRDRVKHVSRSRGLRCAPPKVLNEVWVWACLPGPAILTSSVDKPRQKVRWGQ